MTLRDVLTDDLIRDWAGETILGLRGNVWVISELNKINNEVRCRFSNLPHDGLLSWPTGHDQFLCKSVNFVRRFCARCPAMLDPCLKPHAAQLNRLLICIQLDTITIREHGRPYG